MHRRLPLLALLLLACLVYFALQPSDLPVQPDLDPEVANELALTPDPPLEVAPLEDLRVPTIESEARETLAVASLPLDRVTACVVGLGGEPLADAEVILRPDRGKRRRPRVLRTDEAGCVQFDDVAHGEYLLEVRSGLLLLREAPRFQVPRADLVFELQMDLAAVVRGSVRRLDGTPYPRGSVRFLPDPDPTGQGGHRVRVLRDGSFASPLLTAGQWRVELVGIGGRRTGPNLVAESTTLDLLLGEEVRLEFATVDPYFPSLTGRTPGVRVLSRSRDVRR